MLVGSPGNCLVCPCVNTALSHLYYQCNQYSSPNTLLHHRRCIFQSQHPIASQKMYISAPTPYCITEDVYFSPNTLLHHRCIFQSQHPIASQMYISIPTPYCITDVYFSPNTLLHHRALASQKMYISILVVEVRTTIDMHLNRVIVYFQLRTRCSLVPFLPPYLT